MNGLTDRQMDVLKAWAAHYEEKGYPPTLRELGRRLGIRSTNGVAEHVSALKRKGMMTKRRDLHSRGMRLTAEGAALLTDKNIAVPSCAFWHRGIAYNEVPNVPLQVTG